MKRIKIYKQGDGCEILKGCIYLILSESWTGDDWVPSTSHGLKDDEDLVESLRTAIDCGDLITIFAGSWFVPLADTLGLAESGRKWVTI